LPQQQLIKALLRQLQEGCPQLLYQCILQCLCLWVLGTMEGPSYLLQQLSNPAGFQHTCRYTLPELHEDTARLRLRMLLAWLHLRPRVLLLLLHKTQYQLVCYAAVWHSSSRSSRAHTAGVLCSIPQAVHCCSSKRGSSRV
jgi:hypothetical protein